MTCPKCHGRGERIVRLLEGWREEDYWLACPDCQGRGAAPAPCDSPTGQNGSLGSTKEEQQCPEKQPSSHP